MPANATIIDKPLITATTLKNVVVSITHDRALIIAGIINHVCPQYGINNADKLHEFLATVIHESGGFRIKTENLHYTTAERLVLYGHPGSVLKLYPVNCLPTNTLTTHSFLLTPYMPAAWAMAT